MLSLFRWLVSKYIEATRLNFQWKSPRSPPGLAGPHPAAWAPCTMGLRPWAHSAVSVIPQGEATWPVSALLLLTLGLFPP